MRPPLPSLLAAAVLVIGAASARAEDLQVPAAGALVLDGRRDEPDWERALRLPAPAVQVPAREASAEKRQATPDLRCLVSGGLLWISVALDEDPGIGTGLSFMVAPDGAKTAAEAAALAFLPLELRASLHGARGPRGVGRARYRLRGAADLGTPWASRLEVSFPVADLDLPSPDHPIRLAVVIQTRTPNTAAWAPAGSRFGGCETWFRLLPPEEGWGVPPEIDPASLAAEDARDGERLAAWRRFLDANAAALPPGPPATTIPLMRERLIAPLDVALAARPDLASLRFVKAEVLAKLDLWEEAKAEARLALEAVPGLREASFALHLRVGVEEATEGKPGAATDYAGSLARIEARRVETSDPVEIDGIDLARGILLFKFGDFDQALPLLETLAKRYPFHPPAAENYARCRKYQEAWAAERQFRARDAERDDLPRVRIETARGTVLLELFEDDAPNTVKNFVWLAEHQFLDGSLFHRVVPYFVVQGGDPLSKDPARRAQAGTGGPGYAVPTEPGDQPGQRRRRPFRGMIAMARSPQRNTEGSQFFLTTGTAAHLDGDYSVFGRVLEGQEVVEAIVEGDEIRRVEVVRRREGTVYRPTASSGGPAPEPVARGR